MVTTIECPQDEILQRDLEQLVCEDIPFEQLDGKFVLITGATGLIGSQIVKVLACANREKGYNIHILPFVRNENKALKVLGNILNRNNVHLVKGDINWPISYNGRVDYIIHTANPTSSKFFVDRPVETIDNIVNGTRNVLDFAMKKQILGMAYLSSLEVYGIPIGPKTTISENDYGYIDPLQVRSSYSEGKRIAECLCCSYSAEYGVPIKIARLAQTFGPGVDYNDGRVFAEFARCVIEKKNIVLHTNGNTVRNYCYTKDAVAAILMILIKGKMAEAYNIANERTRISIKDMAQLVCELFPEAGINVTFDFPKDISSFGYNPDMVIELNNSKLKALGWNATVGLKTMFDNLVESMVLRK